MATAGSHDSILHLFESVGSPRALMRFQVGVKSGKFRPVIATTDAHDIVVYRMIRHFVTRCARRHSRLPALYPTLTLQ